MKDNWIKNDPNYINAKKILDNAQEQYRLENYVKEYISRCNININVKL